MEIRDNPIVRVTVTIEKRCDGGLYVYSDDLPGFVLSHIDAHAVLADIEPALGVFLSQRLNRSVSVKPIVGLRDALIREQMIDPTPGARITRREYGVAA
ncbi:hypothetical protein GJ689_12660 [Rhodoplanes serenus]|uniref:Uncharacterized protein n=1 Tax=Rhodoplanes serenus TaxID=200615 RepID=A0A9X4XKZ8_9BRAD|nr:hypothetical protein [Rhodoplanes serenus]MTW17055.1 hypothetical protein [Rhodoplanes serenus]